MPDISSTRMQAGPTPPVTIEWTPWENIPADVQSRFPSMREWNNRMKARDEANREKITGAMDKLQRFLLS